jgi:threonine efflux protein
LSPLSTLSAIALIHLLAIASPGPTLAVVTSYAAGGDRRSGFLVALGVCLATVCWASLAAAGLGTVFVTFPAAYRALQLAGAAYLIWLGIKLLRSVLQAGAASAPSESGDLPGAGWRALRAGFLTNITNPKVVAYYASLFGVMIPSDAPSWLFWAAAATALVVSALWWSTVTLFFAIPAVAAGYQRVRRVADSAMGGILILLGLKLVVFG